MWKIANLGYGNGRNSKTIYPIYMIFGRHMQNTNIYKNMRAFFDFFSNLKLRHKIPWLAASWLPWQPRQKSGFMVLCELFLCTTLPILKVLQKLVFELRLLPCLTNQSPSLVTMATKLKRQPFSKSTGHGLRGGDIIHVGWHLGKCSNLMLKIGLLTIEPPLKTTLKQSCNFTL